ncbi:MAG: NAD(P)H-dependent oxidoreductase subunit E [Oscillospiraceae bacterium]|nr:NAD(P)H-dependent oxidoreductase subunit E [Oscillospiraceae bacterium]
MNCNCKNFTLLEPYLQKYEGDSANKEGNLIPLLQKAQDLYGYLPPDLLAHIAERTGIKLAKIIGVVTFYTQFRTKPAGKNLILLCQGTACHVNGSPAIEQALKEELGVNEDEITDDGLFTYNNVACLGCCSLSPVMMLGDKTYGNLTKDGTVEILKNVRREALNIESAEVKS